MNDDAWDDDANDEPTEDEEIPCPHCGRSIYDDSPRCAHCGNYISKEDAPAARKPWWIILGVILALYAVYRWIVG